MAQKLEKDAVSLSARFAELNKFAQNQEFSKALKVANRSKFYGKIFHLITMGRINLNCLVETIWLFNKAYLWDNWRYTSDCWIWGVYNYINVDTIQYHS